MEYIIKNEKELSFIKNAELNVFNVDNNKINNIHNNVTSELCINNLNVLYNNDTIKKIEQKEKEKKNGDMIEEEEDNYRNRPNIINKDNQHNQENIIKNDITYKNNTNNIFSNAFNNNNNNNNNASQNDMSMNILNNESAKNKHQLTINKDNNGIKKRKKKTKKKNIYMNCQYEENNNNLNHVNIQMKNEIKKNIQKKMNQNDYLLCTINEFLKQGLKNECIPLFQRLQQNLFFLVMLANRPEDNLDDEQSNYSSE
ncbi:conserved Plasmodium protein, unknown function [Plasmodium sp. DRC-Itaito]|nr:conserved Plasmodium protein, unknown function [Plasmodium sp. DRC-Itaito]